ncbi:MAG TPA: LON peptidase substrate-binding domain-containing protein [Gemmatimonadales bacterium]|nr:LON peptidase substrate-binding domain-containing protein [Gemmatimonadales bacterium]
MPSRLPIFPLQAVLFPGTPLPLHIFEPRYKRMLADCLATDRRFGITPLTREGGTPEPGTVGCIAEVRVNQELPDGRSNIVVLGGSRFVLSRVLEESLPYLVALVHTFDDEPDSGPSAEDVSRLRELFTSYFVVLRQLNDAEPEEPTLPDEPILLSFQVAGTVECDPGVKQRLLAERSTARRVKALTQLLPLLTASVETALRVHRRAHTNGQGSSPPDFVAEQ